MVTEKLNAYLADLVVEYLKLHDLHWNVKGKMFVEVHTYTEARYDDIALKFDEVAEKIIMNGATPVTGMAKYLEMATIKELNKGQYTDIEVLKEVLADTIYLKEKAQELRDYFDEEGVFSIVAMLEDHIVTYEKEVWFLNSMVA